MQEHWLDRQWRNHKKIMICLFQITWLRWPVFLVFISLTGCVLGTVVGAVADVAIEVAKVPFKIGGAVIDVATDDEDENEDEDD